MNQAVLRPTLRTFVCHDCREEFPATTKRQGVRDGNPRAELCVRCVKC